MGLALAGAAAFAALGPQRALSQDAPGPDLFFDFSTGVVISDNYEDLENPSGTSSIWQTDLGLTYSTSTRSQSFVTQLGATYETGYYADRPDFDGGVTNPFISVDYILTNKSSFLSFDASYRERDNGFRDDESTSSVDLIVDQGTRADATFGAQLELGRDAPFGARFEASYRDTQFFDTTDPDLNDETRYEVLASLRFDVAPNLSLTFDASYSERDEQNSVNTFETDVFAGIGLAYRTANGLRATGSLRSARNEVTETIDGSRRTDIEDSPILNFRIEQERPNGLVFGEIVQDLSDTGRRTDLFVGRDLELRTGEISATLGVTRGENDSELRGIGSFDYRHELPRGALSFGVSTNVFTDDTDGDVVRGDLRLRWERVLTQLSSVSLQMNVSRSEALDPDGTDRFRSTLEVAYQRRLTENWNFNTGYRYGNSEETNRGDIVENEVFANIGRRFSIRP